MSWGLINTMGALAFGADDGLTTLTGNSESDSKALLADLNGRTLPQLAKAGGGTWTVVWGPVVLTKFAITRYKITNAMYVAQQSGTSDYTIAIAGTDFRSFYDWLVLDLEIDPYTWPYASAGTIENGAWKGLENLQGMTAFSGFPGAGQTLTDFLGTITGSAVNVNVAGHSLGGALTEVVAMWLADTQGSSGWDPSSNATIVPYSYAGPTPGDPTWVGHFNGRFQTSGALRVWNTNDVVPHAWNVTQMQEISTLYGTVSPPNPIEAAAIDAAVKKAEKHDYVQVLANGLTLTEAIQLNLSFADQALFQHTTAYYDLLGIPVPPTS